MKYHKCGKISHIAWFCKSKWQAKNESESDEDDEKSKRSTEKSKTKKDNEKNEKRKPQNRRNRAQAARELDFSDSEASERSLPVIEAAYQVDDCKKWLIDSGATSHCTEDQLIFDSLTPRVS